MPMASISESQGGGLAWDELRELLTQRIRDGLVGRISDKAVSEILAEELGEIGKMLPFSRREGI